MVRGRMQDLQLRSQSRLLEADRRAPAASDWMPSDRSDAVSISSTMIRWLTGASPRGASSLLVPPPSLPSCGPNREKGLSVTLPFSRQSLLMPFVLGVVNTAR